MLLKNFFAGTFESLRGLMLLLESELDSEIPNLRPWRPATTEPEVPDLADVSTTESDLFPARSFLTGTTGLLGGTGGGTPFPSAGFLLVEDAESTSGFRVTDPGPADWAEDLMMVPGFVTPILNEISVNLMCGWQQL